MKVNTTSIFNLIEIFGKTKRSKPQSLNLENHCEQKLHHDFYCDAEEPFVSI
ncbi:hypothetical protein [Maribacter polysaccharolyticus]|uniref:hypothetical protein n=1 Tax=Maribacter polysaccharolyticus TaxID=3020831 RepID=UPI00237FA8C6|nr:hypothetical protein [Maribacter polysaccharolyticus]MDE3743186.1 hypothetical protein [Maribacter polysaccharolyticus]